MGNSASSNPRHGWHVPIRSDFGSSAFALAFWKGVQYLALLGGVALVATLVTRPALGLDILWNGLIPAAPALIVIAPGLWRNICPMATFSLLPRRLGISMRSRLSHRSAAILGAASLTALLLIVPLRHLSLNTDGPMTALMLVAAALVAFALGAATEWRSGWCNGLCPIHPAEKLYGQAPAVTVINARCDACHQCSTPCPDSKRSMHPLITGPSRLARVTAHVMAGGFAGFIWGWYRLPDFAGGVGAAEIFATYTWPFGAGLASLAIYGIAYRWLFLDRADRQRLLRLAAAAAVCTYYWYRIPALAGFGPHPGSGMLADLTEAWPTLPLWSHAATTTFFCWFLMIRRDPARSWMHRPPDTAYHEG